MNLFNTKKALKPTTSNPLILETPLGTINFRLFLNKKEISIIAPSETLYNGKTTLARWNLDNCFIEFAKIEFDPKIPINMSVDACFAGIWRIKNLSKNLDLTFNTCLIDNREESPDSGEGFISQLFENNNVILSIGTEDDEYLNNRAKKNNWMPFRLNKSMQAETVDIVPGGVQTVLPSLESDECIQIQSIVAWAKKSHPEASTWFAVDQKPDFILNSQGIL